MNCRQVDEFLDDYLEGRLAPGETALIEVHLRDCAACRDGCQRLRGVLEQAAALPGQIEPPTDLWPGIAGRIEKGKVVSLLTPDSRRSSWRVWVSLAAAAVLLVAITATLTWRLTSRPVQTVPPGGLDATGGVVLSTYKAAEPQYEAAMTALMAEFDRQRDHLSPHTVAEIERNLKIIDKALSHAKQALEQDPSNADLGLLVAGMQQRKRGLLEQANRLGTMY